MTEGVDVGLVRGGCRVGHPAPIPYVNDLLTFA